MDEDFTDVGTRGEAVHESAGVGNVNREKNFTAEAVNLYGLVGGHIVRATKKNILATFHLP